MNPQQPSQPVSYNSGSGHGSSMLLTITLVALLLLSLGFGIWAFMGRQDYKNKSDQKAAAAVEKAKKEQAIQLNAQFAEQSKSPYKVFSGSPTYGSISFNYPKTWSAYVDTNGSQPINGYFHPDQVPGLQSKTAFALRLELVDTDYTQVVGQFNSKIKTGVVKAKAYLPPKLNGVANVQPGTMLSGQVGSEKTQQGTMLVIKVRDKTLLISTLSNSFLKDFSDAVLASLNFSP